LGGGEYEKQYDKGEKRKKKEERGQIKEKWKLKGKTKCKMWKVRPKKVREE
jgi:hypothetical protein